MPQLIAGTIDSSPLASCGVALRLRPVKTQPERVVLVNPPWITRDSTIWHGIRGAMPPLSLLSMGAVLEEAGHAVSIVDAHVDKLTELEFREEIMRRAPTFVGITMMTSTAITGHRIAQIVKEVDPETTVVVGGVHPDALPDETLRARSIDYVVRGDGEYTLLDLVDRKPDAEILGISHRKDGAVVHNPSRPVLMDLGSLPRYAYHLAPMKKYYPAVGAYRRLPAINMLMTRGCPGKCIFCNSAETTLRTRPAAQVVDEIIHLRDAHGIREIQFYDDTFTVMKKNALEFCRLMKERDVGVTWSCFARTDCFSESMAKALKEGGCHQVMFGVEAGNSEILETIRKPIDLERTLRAVRIAKDVGIEVRAAFTFGTPGETPATIEDTVDYALRLDPDLAIFNITTPYPGTQLYAWAEKNDRLTTHDWWDYELGSMVMDLGSISKAELEAEYKAAFKRFYNRPRMYWRRLMKIRSLRQFKDTADAFLHIVLNAHLAKRTEQRRDWLHHTREDFFELDLKMPRKIHKLPTVLQDDRLLRTGS